MKRNFLTLTLALLASLLLAIPVSAAEYGAIYTEAEALREGIPHIPLNDTEVELHAIEVQESTYDEEADFVAGRIRELLDGKHCVRNKDTLRPIQPEDIVILLRSPGSVGQRYVDALDKSSATDGFR